MCRTGGRRCPSSGGRRADAPATAGAGTAVTDPPATQAVSAETIAEVRASEQRERLAHNRPTHDDADELAAKLPADRRDGLDQPLDDRGRRFFALREAGYTGPIDQDGYPAPTGEAANILRRMAEQRGEDPAW